MRTSISPKGNDMSHRTGLHRTGLPRPGRRAEPKNGTILLRTLVAVASVLVALFAPAAASAAGAHRAPHRVPDRHGHRSGFNRPGDILIADQFNNRVIELDQHHHVVWQYGLGPNDFSARSIIGVNDVQRVGSFTLMAGTGDPAGVTPACTDPNGCADNRVILVNPAGHIVWQYGQFGVTGSGPEELSAPVQSTWLPNWHVLITDQGNQRVIEVNLAGQIVWQYGTTGLAGMGPDQLNSPNSAELLRNGHVLIADESNNRVIEVDRAHDVVATYTAGGTLGAVAFASRLRNGDTLMTDAGNNRAVEVDAADNVVWEYATNTDPASNPSPAPTRAIRLRNGDTLISDQFNDRVIEVNMAKQIVFTVGTINVPGFGPNALNAPYDAKVVGDYTGLTPPFR